jgi:hypothetical protein
MALKGARTIAVRDRTFKWKFKGKGYGGKQPMHLEGAPPDAKVVIQEAVDRPGIPLCVDVESMRWVSQETHDMDTGHLRHVASLTPRDVRKIIEVALDAGWVPEARKAFREVPVVELTDYRTVGTVIRQ